MKDGPGACTFPRVLKYRLLLGPPLILLLLGVIWGDERLRATTGYRGMLFTGLMLLAGAIAGRELTKIFRARSIVTSVRVNSTSIMAGMLCASLFTPWLTGVDAVAAVSSVAGAVLMGSLLYYSRGHNVEGVVASSAAAVLAFVYVGLLSGFLILLLKEFSGWVMLGVVLVTKACDIGAYFVGRSIGRHKLIPWLSPGKTWEGFFGGVASSALAGLVAAQLTAYAAVTSLPNVAWWQGLILGAIFGAVGQAGDLVASLLKRDAGMKDYSRALPGFGGVMDVVDSPLLVAPVAYWLLRLVASTSVPGAPVTP
jgi:phosphatidate cytidylyltransferase